MSVAESRVYLRPTGFVDVPASGALRLAGGLTWFSAVELIVVEGSRRVRQTLVPVTALSDAADGLPPALADQAKATLARLTAPRTPFMLGTTELAFDRPEVMGILNVTPDSFSDGGSGGDPLARADAMRAAGAALIDVGGESTRPGAQLVPVEEEIARVAPVVAQLHRAGAAISVDTRKADVMAAALDAGAGLINDVSAMTWDHGAMALVAARGCPVVLMHHQGAPETMQQDPRYDDVLIDVYDWLAARIDAAVAAGIDRSRIMIDPGIGFGKTLSHNLALLNGLSLFHGLGCPILLGVSRKRSIAALSGGAPVDQRLGGSVALAVFGIAQGVQLLRVHDVFETVQAVRVWCGLRDEALATV
ncbi:dihydropteroate synthase [Sphingomonas sp.]|uniref:dihydropteroate synthase n=1 Tax=Sphingomonas sp. TaxID=28214 RepID=UPI003B3BBC24